MSHARKAYSPDEKKKILKMAEEGWTYIQIADKVRPGVKTAWRSIGDIVRQERQKREMEENTPTQVPTQDAPPRPMPPPKPSNASLIDIPEGMSDSLTAKEFLSMLDDEQKELMIATYEDLRGEGDEDTLTKAENDMLIRAAYSNVRYIHAQKMLNKAEQYMLMDMEGYLGKSDEDNGKRRLAGRADAFKKDAEASHKEYIELINDLKLTRKQRLDKIKDTRNTFLDLQQSLMERNKQENLIEDIKRLNGITKNEFYRLSLGQTDDEGNSYPWLLGAFDDVIDPEELKKLRSGEKELPEE
jgi:hypothetical protein